MIFGRFGVVWCVLGWFGMVWGVSTDPSESFRPKTITARDTSARDTSARPHVQQGHRGPFGCDVSVHFLKVFVIYYARGGG